MQGAGCRVDGAWCTEQGAEQDKDEDVAADDEDDMMRRMMR